jgi:hypothetical protein
MEAKVHQQNRQGHNRMKILIEPSDLPKEFAGLGGNIEIRSLDPDVVEKRDLDIARLIQEPPIGFFIDGEYYSLIDK